jgi:hypothetical protein
MVTLDGKEVEILESGSGLNKVKFIWEDDCETRWVRDARLVVPKPPRTSLGTQLFEGGALPPLTVDETPTFVELLHAWELVESVRVLAPARIENAAKQLFDRLGIEYPSDWRGTSFGLRGGTEEQRTIASTVTLKDGRTFNSLRLTLRLLSDGRSEGWKVTKSA